MRFYFSLPSPSPLRMFYSRLQSSCVKMESKVHWEGLVSRLTDALDIGPGSYRQEEW